MKISPKEVEHIALLSRLKLNQGEVEKFSQELTAILSYIDELKEIKTEKVAVVLPTSASVHKPRQDEVKDFKNKKNILKNAPKVSTNFIEVSKVLK